MGTVCSSSLLWCLVDLDVLDDQLLSVETLGLCVCLRVLEETEEKLGGLDWPAGTGDTELLSCYDMHDQHFVQNPYCKSQIPHTLCSTTSSTSVSSHWDGLLVLLNVLKELHGTGELPAIDGLSGLAGVLERNSKVGSARAARLVGVYLWGVSDL